MSPLWKCGRMFFPIKKSLQMSSYSAQKKQNVYMADGRGTVRIESHRGENWRGSEEGSKIERRIATFLDDDTVSAQVKDDFSSQVLLGWEDAFQGRFVELTDSTLMNIKFSVVYLIVLVQIPLL